MGRVPTAPTRHSGGRPMFGGLKLLLIATRLFTAGGERRLPNLLHASREA